MSIKVEGSAPLMQVFDMPTSVAFYRDVLGFSVVKQSGPGDDFDWGLLKLDGVELMLNTAYCFLAAGTWMPCMHSFARRVLRSTSRPSLHTG
jgi:catechol 2,3-dioxygenase-like lactoylglutathione lyase family enzyme